MAYGEDVSTIYLTQSRDIETGVVRADMEARARLHSIHAVTRMLKNVYLSGHSYELLVETLFDNPAARGSLAAKVQRLQDMYHMCAPRIKTAVAAIHKLVDGAALDVDACKHQEVAHAALDQLMREHERWRRACDEAEKWRKKPTYYPNRPFLLTL